ncbi:hypothetical protein Vadar_017963 [Vaccinium darrowii]|uniref:Uncharacterized protein n=1 Tax=Vaccinium darrowii TaxID=229202 RepID=A0ACB7Y8T7_9ERIC|nr:hypothetical protein Vadar_017963 [Vaccinium darrowii]
MDVYGGVSAAADCFPIDDLLDFSCDAEHFTTTDTTLHNHQHLLSSDRTYSAAGAYCTAPNPNHYSADFTEHLCVPSDDVAELEWLSNFVDDSFSDFPSNSFPANLNLRPDNSSHGRSRTKRPKSAAINKHWTSSPESTNPILGKPKSKRNDTSSSSSEQTGDRFSPSPSENSQAAAARRCTHCLSEKTPQWRAGPLGPKTLCNACGVRYKSGRLVPEYRPAASPTFVLTQHSNSHRKVMELRRQKEEITRQQQQQQQQEEEEQQLFGHHRRRDFQVC